MSKEAIDHQAGLDWYNQLIIDCNTADERLAAAVEAMRAKCEAIAQAEEETDHLFAAARIKRAIAALKGNGEG
jgi:hypothetical protein